MLVTQGDVREAVAVVAAVHVLSVPVHTLVDAESYLAVLDGFDQKLVPGTDFA